MKNSEMFLIAVLAYAAIGFHPPCSAQAQTVQARDTDYVFVSPTFAGERTLTSEVKLGSNESLEKTEFWLHYSSKGDEVAAHTGGRARGTATGAKQRTASVKFVFPHAGSPKPNAQDVNSQILRSRTQVYFSLEKRTGEESVYSPVYDFNMPQPFTIVNFGDSYASGEGAPNEGARKWDDETCHRSSQSGQAKYVAWLKKQWPQLSIAFKNVACSGAGILDGVTDFQTKKGWLDDFRTEAHVVPQVQQASTWLNTNNYERINLALLSIGGNDVNFGKYVERYMVGPFDFSAEPRAQAQLSHMISNVLPHRYATLIATFDGEFEYDRVLVTAYPDLTRDATGATCGAPLKIYGTCWGVVEATSGAGEYEAFRRLFIRAINARIKEELRGQSKWDFIADVQDTSAKNGICNCDKPWFNTMGASVAGQGDIFGIVHPNRRGHKNMYLEALQSGFAFKKLQIDRSKNRARELKIEAAKNDAVKKARRKVAMAEAKVKAKAKLAAAKLRNEEEKKLVEEAMPNAEQVGPPEGAATPLAASVVADDPGEDQVPDDSEAAQ